MSIHRSLLVHGDLVGEVVNIDGGAQKFLVNIDGDA